MHPKVQLAIADINHIELNNVGQPFDAFHDWPSTSQVTSKDKTMCHIEKQDRKRRSDSFSDEWQDHTSEVSMNDLRVKPQHISPELHSDSEFDKVNFASLSKTVFHQCFHSGSYDNSNSHKQKYDLHKDQ